MTPNPHIFKLFPSPVERKFCVPRRPQDHFDFTSAPPRALSSSIAIWQIPLPRDPTSLTSQHRLRGTPNRYINKNSSSQCPFSIIHRNPQVSLISIGCPFMLLRTTLSPTKTIPSSLTIRVPSLKKRFLQRAESDISR